ncbi:MAG: hypothetical protein COC09_09885 [Gammaproteobacteria bacterium]|nr:MAG: hypothetical protein COC09_09885 [Gammaproteobacteria bacterium]
MNIERKQMESELKEYCISFLRERGFKGSFPNLYKETKGFVCLINFQFFSSGGSFCINLSYAEPNRNNVYYKKETEAKKLKASQTRKRVRLGSENLEGDNWFSFGKTSYGEFRGNPTSPSELIEIINNLITNQAELWWVTKNEKTKS